MPTCSICRGHGTLLWDGDPEFCKLCNGTGQTVEPRLLRPPLDTFRPAPDEAMWFPEQYPGDYE